MPSLWCTAEDRGIALCSKTCLRPARLLFGKTKTSLGIALLFSGVIVHGLSPLYPEAVKAFLETDSLLHFLFFTNTNIKKEVGVRHPDTLSSRLTPKSIAPTSCLSCVKETRVETHTPTSHTPLLLVLTPQCHMYWAGLLHSPVPLPFRPHLALGVKGEGELSINLSVPLLSSLARHCLMRQKQTYIGCKVVKNIVSPTFLPSPHILTSDSQFNVCGKKKKRLKKEKRMKKKGEREEKNQGKGSIA